MLMAIGGKISGNSGIAGGIVTGRVDGGRLTWRVSYVAGLLLVGAVTAACYPCYLGKASDLKPWAAALAGVLVGVGTRMGAGCTSGHGVCGLARFSRRSLAAFGTFVSSGMVTATLVHASAHLHRLFYNVAPSSHPHSYGGHLRDKVATAVGSASDVSRIAKLASAVGLFMRQTRMAWGSSRWPIVDVSQQLASAGFKAAGAAEAPEAVGTKRGPWVFAGIALVLTIIFHQEVIRRLDWVDKRIGGLEVQVPAAVGRRRGRTASDPRLPSSMSSSPPSAVESSSSSRTPATSLSEAKAAAERSILLHAAAGICGILFGIGLVISGMVDARGKVMGFLLPVGVGQLADQQSSGWPGWDATLPMVMLGSLAVNTAGYQLLHFLGRRYGCGPVLGEDSLREPLHRDSRSDTDAAAGFGSAMRTSQHQHADMFNRSKTSYDQIIKLGPSNPFNRTIDIRLVLGALVFGIGWGLSGACPGPLLLGLGARSSLSLVAAPWCAVGFLVHDLVADVISAACSCGTAAGIWPADATQSKLRTTGCGAGVASG
jgi:uncharacterized membrane protein YedE/YeeE